MDSKEKKIIVRLINSCGGEGPLSMAPYTRQVSHSDVCILNIGLVA
jgi:hypothetical protein